MWYEKFNWDLYSCSKTKDRAMPVYSMSFHYTLGHRAFFLPTHWFAYKYFFVMSDYWLAFRRELHESFFFTYLALLALLGLLLAASAGSLPPSPPSSASSTAPAASGSSAAASPRPS